MRKLKTLVKYVVLIVLGTYLGHAAIVEIGANAVTAIVVDSAASLIEGGAKE